MPILDLHPDVIIHQVGTPSLGDHAYVVVAIAEPFAKYAGPRVAGR